MKYALPVIIVSTGCGVTTSDLVANFEVTPAGPHVRVTAYLYEGSSSSPDFFQLEDGDHLVAVFRGHEQMLAGQAGYSTTFDLDTALAADETMTVELRRDSETSATATSITIPAEPVVAPIPLFVSRAKDLAISWSPATDDKMGWSLEALESYTFNPLHGDIAPGATSATIAASSLPQGGSTFTATLTVRRYRSAPVDTAFAGGDIVCRWSEITEFASTP